MVLGSLQLVYEMFVNEINLVLHSGVFCFDLNTAYYNVNSLTIHGSTKKKCNLINFFPIIIFKSQSIINIIIPEKWEMTYKMKIMG